MSRNGKRFLVSLLLLFLEPILSRWISVKIRVFTHNNVNNFAPLACLMGSASRFDRSIGSRPALPHFYS